MNLGFTVNDLAKACKEQIEKGNGDKHILISNDDEGNGFHTLFYLFTDNTNNGFNELIEMEHDKTHNSNSCVILG